MTFKSLKQSQPVINLAYALGIKLSPNPVNDILKLCDQKIEKIMLQMPDCSSLDEMLAWVANKVQTVFEVIENDEDLINNPTKKELDSEHDL